MFKAFMVILVLSHTSIFSQNIQRGFKQVTPSITNAEIIKKKNLSYEGYLFIDAFIACSQVLEEMNCTLLLVKKEDGIIIAKRIHENWSSGGKGWNQTPGISNVIYYFYIKVSEADVTTVVDFKLAKDSV